METVNKNFHTHTYRCNHACGDVDAYYNQALKLGFSSLGFTDHVPFPYKKEAFKSIFLWRMRHDEISDYLSKIDSLKARSKDIKIYSGFECEYFKEFDSYYKELLDRCDYLILGAHFFFDKSSNFRSAYEITNTKEGIISYAENVIQGLSTGYFKLLAHPDVFGILYPKWDTTCEDISRSIIQTCVEMDIPLEINGFGVAKGLIQTEEGPRYRYPWDNFWKLVSNYPQAKVVINSDAHYPWMLNAGFTEAIKLKNKYKLNLIDLF